MGLRHIIGQRSRTTIAWEETLLRTVNFAIQSYRQYINPKNKGGKNSSWQAFDLSCIFGFRDEAKTTRDLDEIKKLFDLQDNEWILLHGTSAEAARHISNDGFDMSRGGGDRMFGSGAYFAESLTKADEY